MNLRESIGILAAGGLLLALCAAGAAWIVLGGELFTVDGLFMTLILLTIAGVIALELLLEFRRRGEGVEAAARPATRAAAAGSAMAAGAVTEVGMVEKVQFYEAPVGQPTKTLLALRNGAAKEARWLTFEGNVLHLLPPGRRVRIQYRPGADVNVLLSAEKS